MYLNYYDMSAIHADRAASAYSQRDVRLLIKQQRAERVAAKALERAARVEAKTAAKTTTAGAPARRLSFLSTLVRGRTRSA